MAIAAGAVIVGDLEVQFWQDPKRWRAMIWRGMKLVRRMHDSDPKRIRARALAWMREHAEPGLDRTAWSTA